MGVIDQVLGAVGGGAQGYTAGRNQEIALARQKMLDQLMMQNMGSEQALRRSEIAKNERQASMPIPGTPEYLQYLLSLAEGKGKVATQTAVNTAAGVAPIKTGEAIATAKGVEPIKTAGAIAAEAGKFPYQVGVASARAGLAPRAQAARAAQPEIDSAINTLSQYDQPGAAGRLFSRKALGGYAVSQEGQIANQAAEQLARAYLSRTGRTPTIGQIQGAAQQILVQPGEENNQTVIANKRALRSQWAQEVRTLGAPGQSAPGVGTPSTGKAALKSKTGLFDDLLPKPDNEDEE